MDAATELGRNPVVSKYYNDRYRVLTRGFPEPMVVDAGDTGVLLILFLIALLDYVASLRPRRESF